MITSVPITEFRKDLFKYADLVAFQGYEFEIEKKGRKLFKIVKLEDDLKAKAERALAILPKIAGKLGVTDRKFFRGRKEIDYMKKLGSKW